MIGKFHTFITGRYFSFQIQNKKYAIILTVLIFIKRRRVLYISFLQWVRYPKQNFVTKMAQKDV